MEILPLDLIDCICDYLTIGEMTLLSEVSKSLNLDILSNKYYLFCKQVYTESLNIYKFVVNLMRNFTYFKRFYFSNHHITADKYAVFEMACFANNLDMVEWTMEQYLRYTGIEYPDEGLMWTTFVITCENNALDSAKWLTAKYFEHIQLRFESIISDSWNYSSIYRIFLIANHNMIKWITCTYHIPFNGYGYNYADFGKSLREVITKKIQETA